MNYLSQKKGFLGYDANYKIENKVVVVPFGLEKTVSYGGGTKNGPKEIIRASHQVELFDEELKKEPYKEIGIKTLKPFPIKKNIVSALDQLSKINEKLISKNKFPMVFGGEHSITPGSIRPFINKYNEIIGLVFLAYFGIKFSGESKRRSDAVNKLQQVIAKEYELESLGGQAAAAAHSLGTPLATINVVASELKKDLGNNKEFSKDIDLLITETRRCGEILKKISKKQIKEDEFFSKTQMEALIQEIVESFKETSSKEIYLISEENKNLHNFQRSPELVYGLRNFIGNAVKFSKTTVEIVLKSNEKTVTIEINDDGPGFQDDIKEIIGEPYIKSKSKLVSSNSGTGLGTFLGKTLLERKSASLNFQNNTKLGGASVIISWKLSDLDISV